MQKKEQIIQVVKSYENGKLNSDDTLKAILDITGYEIDRDYLDNYWRDEDLNSFAENLLMEEV